MKPYKNLFKDVLTEEIKTVPDDGDDTQISDQEAYEMSLDADTPKDALDPNPSDFTRITKENVEKAKSWIAKFEEFSLLINDINNPNSFNKFINQVDREGSPFRGIVRSETKRITRLAEECTSVAEVLKSYVIGSEKKERELLQQFPNLTN